VVTRPNLLAFGERVARLRDPQRHLWWVHQREEDVSPEELAAPMPPPRRRRPVSSGSFARSWRVTAGIGRRAPCLTEVIKLTTHRPRPSPNRVSRTVHVQV
jgi:hypothetical protein